MRSIRLFEPVFPRQPGAGARPVPDAASGAFWFAPHRWWYLSIRTAAPLVGACLDRIVHPVYAEDLAPLDLAARAEVTLQLVNGETGLSVVDLLEPV